MTTTAERILKLQALVKALESGSDLTEDQKHLQDSVFEKHTRGWMDDDDRRIIVEVAE